MGVTTRSLLSATIVVVIGAAFIIGCDNKRNRLADRKNAAREYRAIVGKYGSALERKFREAARVQDSQYNECSIIKSTSALSDLPNFEYVWRADIYRRAVRVYKRLAAELDDIDTNDKTLRRGVSAIRANAKALKRFRNANTETCELLTQWKRSPKAFNELRAVGVNETYYPRYLSGNKEIQEFTKAVYGESRKNTANARRFRAYVDISLWGYADIP